MAVAHFTLFGHPSGSIWQDGYMFLASTLFIGWLV